MRKRKEKGDKKEDDEVGREKVRAEGERRKEEGPRRKDQGGRGKEEGERSHLLTRRKVGSIFNNWCLFLPT